MEYARRECPRTDSRVTRMDRTMIARCRTALGNPGRACLENGQVVKRQVDLLLETPTGWVLIDHKRIRAATMDGKELL